MGQLFLTFKGGYPDKPKMTNQKATTRWFWVSKSFKSWKSMRFLLNFQTSYPLPPSIVGGGKSAPPSQKVKFAGQKKVIKLKARMTFTLAKARLAMQAEMSRV